MRRSRNAEIAAEKSFQTGSEGEFLNASKASLTYTTVIMNLQRIILIVVILIVLGGGYYYYQVYNAAPTPEGQSPVASDLDSRLNEIRPLASVELDISVLDGMSFRSLRIASATTGPAVAPGRSNPFTPF